MWPPAVVVGTVPGKDGPQVPLNGDQDPVGEFSSGGQHEPFGEAVRSRTSRRDLHSVDAGAGQDGVEGSGELAGPVADEEPEGGGGRRDPSAGCGSAGWSRLRSDGSSSPGCGRSGGGPRGGTR